MSNLPASATAESVRGIFQQFGTVSNVELRDGRTFCFVSFESPDGVTAALQSQALSLDGQKLR